MGRHAGRTEVVLASCAFLILLTGCGAMQPTQVSLDYKLPKGETASVSLQGMKVTVAPFTDARTSEFLFRKSIVVREGEDVGFWVANALCMEMKSAGAEVDRVAAGAPPAKGSHIRGRVNVLRADPKGWTPGGLIAAAIGTGYWGTVDVTLEVFQDGIPVLTQQYTIKHKRASDPVQMVLVGPMPEKDVPATLQEALCRLIRTQLLADIRRVLAPEKGR